MYIDEPENEREELEDKIYDLYPMLDMTDIQCMTDEQLNDLLYRARTGIAQGKPGKPPKPPKPLKPLIQRWKRASVNYEIRDGKLVHVEKWRMGLTEREKVKPCGQRVTYEGEQMSAAILKHYLINGEWVKRIPKPAKKFKAVVTVAGKSVHLGYFATVEEKDQAIFLHKLGIFAKKT